MAVIYSMFSNTNNMAFRMGAGSRYPLITNSGNPKVLNGYVVKGMVMTGAEMISVGSVDKWMHVTAIDGIACDGYTAQISNGWTYCVLTEIPVVDPGVKQEITFVSIVPHYDDGSVGVSEDYYPVV